MGVFGYSVGVHGTIVRIDSGTITNVNNSNSGATDLLVVLDRSGSMGGNVEVFVKQVLPHVHERLGFGESAQTTILAFDDRVERVMHNRDEMRVSNLRCRGSTYLAPALSECLNILEKNPNQSYYLIVLSDGAISDRDAVLRIADSMSEQLAHRQAPVIVSLIRAFTSSAQPDTQGLACFGQLNSGGYLAPKDLDMSSTSPITIADCILDDLSVLGTIKLSIHGGTVGRRPGEVKDEIYLPVFHGEPVCVIASSSAAELSINDEIFEIVMEKGSEDRVMPLLQYIESQVRQKMVIRTATCLEEAKAMVQWIKDVTPYLTSIAEENYNFTARSIIAQIKSSASRVEKSILNRIAQLANDSRVETMNAARCAEFLREGLKNNQLGKAVARRAANTDAEDPNVYCRSAFKELLSFRLENLESEGYISFYSPFTTKELLQEVQAQYTIEEVDQLGATDILQIVGCIGVSYRAPVQACPDPWMYYIEEVYASPACFLSQNDLWISRMQGKAHSSELMAPGFSSPITGVLPLSFGNPTCETFIRKARDICQLHMGACMRDSLIRLPYDHQAILTAAAVRAATQMYTKPNEACGIILDAILRDLIKFTCNCKLNDELLMLKAEDPRTMMAGDLGVSTCGKPIAALFTCLLEDDSPLFFRAILSYDLYKACSIALDGMDRKIVLNSVLGVNLNMLPSVGELFEEPDEVNFDNRIDICKLLDNEYTQSIFSKCMVGVKGLLALQSARVFLRNSLAMGIHEAVRLYTPLQESELIPDKKGAVTLSLLAQAILSKDLSDRINRDDVKRKYKFPDIDSERLGLAYLRTLKERMCDELFNGLIQNKRKKERDVILGHHIDELYACSFDEFCEKLTSSYDPVSGVALIPNRDCEGYRRLFEKLITEIPSDNNSRANQVHKIFCLCLGKKPQGKEWVPFFCNGCSVRGVLDLVKRPLREFGVIGMGFEELKEAICSGALHIYRSSDLPNRHGHCQSNPSWWAQGFSSISEFQSFLGTEKFRNYLKQRGEHAPHALTT